MKHTNSIETLGSIIDAMDDNIMEAWWTVMGVTVPGLEEAIVDCAVDVRHEALACSIEGDYLREHGEDWYEVSWPDHVVVAHFNSDANYLPLGK